MSHVTYEWVMSHMNESCHIWMSHVTYEWVMSHMYESCPIRDICVAWLPFIGSLKLYVSFAKEPYKRDDVLQKRPIIWRGLLIVATPHPYVYSHHSYGTTANQLLPGAGRMFKAIWDRSEVHMTLNDLKFDMRPYRWMWRFAHLLTP